MTHSLIYLNRLKHKKRLHFGDKAQCFHWNFEKSVWLSNGCFKIVNESDLFQTVCKCNHLTNFAALMDISGREKNDLSKSILSYFCCGLSIIGLVLTILIILKPEGFRNRDLRVENKKRLKVIINCNLCICLLVSNITVILGMDRTNVKVCQYSKFKESCNAMETQFWIIIFFEIDFIILRKNNLNFCKKKVCKLNDKCKT